MPPELAGAWINSTANIGIAGGAAIGAGVLHVAGPSVLPWPGAVLIACGLGRNASVPPSIPARALSDHVRFNASSEVDGYSSADRT